MKNQPENHHPKERLNQSPEFVLDPEYAVLLEKVKKLGRNEKQLLLITCVKIMEEIIRGEFYSDIF